MIPVSAEKEGKVCTHADCHPRRWADAAAVIWCPKCGEARCERHRQDLPTRSCCVSIIVFERRP